MDKNTNKCCEKCHHYSSHFQKTVCALPDCECHTQSRHEDWRKEFDDNAWRFHEHIDEENCRFYPEELKSFIASLLTQAREEERARALKAVEAEMLDKIYYIGNELPQVKADVRDKFVLLGFPQKFLDAVLTRLTGDDPQQQS